MSHDIAAVLSYERHRLCLIIVLGAHALFRYIHRQAQRHCDKVDRVFSNVVDCCGESLASVESILTGTRTIVDDEGTGGRGEMRLSQ